jgi:prepilin-type N-terminal cleavage/methylation domain-containing protein
LNQLKQKRAADGGFTLVELLITIVIIGILAAVVVLAIGGLTDSGEDSACQATADAAEAAAIAFYSDQTVGSWPDAWGDLVPTYMTTRSGTTVTDADTITGNGWTITLGAGGTAQTTFTCANT